MIFPCSIRGEFPKIGYLNYVEKRVEAKFNFFEINNNTNQPMM